MRLGQCIQARNESLGMRLGHSVHCLTEWELVMHSFHLVTAFGKVIDHRRL